MSLLLTTQGAGAFTSVLGAPDLTGTQIGIADVNIIAPPGAIPETSTWGMMIFGLGVAGYALRQRKSKPQLA